MSNEKSLAQILRESKGKPLTECPWCGNTTNVRETPEGLIDCYRCPPRMARQEGGTKLCPETGEVIEVKPLTPDQELRRDIAQVLKEDQSRGTPGSSSSGGPTRKKPLKRKRARVEQDSFGGPGQRDKTKTKRLCKMIRREITISEECYDHLLKYQYQERNWDGSKPPLISLIRRFLNKKLTTVCMTRIPRGTPRKELQEMLTPNELTLLKDIKDEYKTNGEVLSWGDIVEVGIKKFLKLDDES